MDLAEEAGCYKVILDCAESNAAFYAKAGLSRKEVQMVSGMAWPVCAGRCSCVEKSLLESWVC